MAWPTNLIFATQVHFIEYKCHGVKSRSQEWVRELRLLNAYEPSNAYPPRNVFTTREWVQHGDIFEGYRVKVSITGAEEHVCLFYSRVVCFQLKRSHVKLFGVCFLYCEWYPEWMNCVIPLLHTAISEHFRGVARRRAIQIHVYFTLLYFTVCTELCQVSAFIPAPPTVGGERHYVFGLSVRSSVHLSCSKWRDISVLGGGISMKLLTNIHYVTEHCWKGSQGGSES